LLGIQEEQLAGVPLGVSRRDAKTTQTALEHAQVLGRGDHDAHPAGSQCTIDEFDHFIEQEFFFLKEADEVPGMALGGRSDEWAGSVHGFGPDAQANRLL
jgi:hypothetical protein